MKKINVADGSYASCTMFTPGIFGVRPIVMGGPVTFFSASVCFGGGPSYTTFIMGTGVGTVTSSFLMDNLEYGLDIGFDVMGGLSVPIYLSPLY